MLAVRTEDETVMQTAFRTVGFDATAVRHQRLRDSLKVFFQNKKTG